MMQSALAMRLPTLEWVQVARDVIRGPVRNVAHHIVIFSPGPKDMNVILIKQRSTSRLREFIPHPSRKGE